jgi:DNA-binding NtrC family response regulator
VGDIEMALQGKLLKAVEERSVRRVGGIRDRRINVRILAATNRDLEREAARERFRRDLYFRLAVILLRLPPLRERGEDILLLADRFLSRFAAKYGKDVSRIDGRARDLLLAYPWPGNVRELSHVIERAVLWSRGQTLDAEHLALSTPTLASADPPSAAASDPLSAPPPRGMDLEQWERSLIEQAMREEEGNQTRAAQRLGISRDTLRYRLKKFGLGDKAQSG